MAREVVAMVAGRAPVLAGVGRGVRDACRLARASADAGATALMIHQPPDPFVSPRGTVDYVKAIAEAGGLPMMLYLRNDAIGTKAIADLCAIPGVKGVKWATPNPLRLAEARAACDPAIVWVGGLAEVWAPTFYAVRRPRLHLGADQRLAGAVDGDPRRARSRRLCQGARPDRRDDRLRGHPRRGAERHQRHRGQGCAAGSGARLRSDPPAVGLAADGGRAPARSKAFDWGRTSAPGLKSDEATNDRHDADAAGRAEFGIRRTASTRWRRRPRSAGETTFTSGHLIVRRGAGDTSVGATGRDDPAHRPGGSATAAFWSYGYGRAEARAAFLEKPSPTRSRRAGAEITAIGTRKPACPPRGWRASAGAPPGSSGSSPAHIRKGD